MLIITVLVLFEYCYMKIKPAGQLYTGLHVSMLAC